MSSSEPVPKDSRITEDILSLTYLECEQWLKEKEPLGWSARHALHGKIESYRSAIGRYKMSKIMTDYPRTYDIRRPYKQNKLLCMLDRRIGELCNLYYNPLHHDWCDIIVARIACS